MIDKKNMRERIKEIKNLIERIELNKTDYNGETIKTLSRELSVLEDFLED